MFSDSLIYSMTCVCVLCVCCVCVYVCVYVCITGDGCIGTKGFTGRQDEDLYSTVECRDKGISTYMYMYNTQQ